MFANVIWITGVVAIFLGLYVCTEAADNITCYQCTKNVLEECGPEDLKQCPPEKDRCVTHITKDAKNGFSIKRECGLGPCVFDDNMMNRGLGLDGCDRSKDEYFCLFCCRMNGCNKSSAELPKSSFYFIATVVTLCFFTIRFTSFANLL